MKKPDTTTRLCLFELDEMTVAELREILDRCPEDAKVKVDEDDYFAVAPGEEPIPQILFPTTKGRQNEAGRDTQQRVDDGVPS